MSNLKDSVRVFALVLPDGGLWGFRYSEEDAMILAFEKNLDYEQLIPKRVSDKRIAELEKKLDIVKNMARSEGAYLTGAGILIALEDKP